MLKERNKLLNHDLYTDLWNSDALRVFMKYHVFCVWDFQSLIKKIQDVCSPRTMPWMPSERPEFRRLINEIVLEEETDVDPTGGYCSHYELYLKAMTQVGADKSFHESYLNEVAVEGDVFVANQSLPRSLQDFMDFSFKLIYDGKDHEIMAVFAGGRESLIPDMFTSIVEKLSIDLPEEWSIFHYYLTRHIEVDGGDHGPASEKLLDYFCDTEDKKNEANIAVAKALHLRGELWTFILDETRRDD
ncbi:DUF3050 domain-containing protein [Lentisphaera profundi]|uniref:DUF3050 domain-containing protein n=1 Tax=Lentisphaera profundi TaxID=1658616 RepID=A0ABY7VUX0_9BACT|nr:DUF3050 domain-containing protein [Lentisphaera profundi]WDE98015.1 DUF3050 domain-containing protein [Lentisphaera profundi]